MADTFDIEGARKAGYSDAEIADHLAQSRGFDAAGARKAGYSDAEILQHLTPPPAESFGEGLWKNLPHPIDMLNSMVASHQRHATAAQEAWQAGDYGKAALHAAAATIPGAGLALDQMGATKALAEQAVADARSGHTADAVQHGVQAVPLAGPILASAIEQGRQGNGAGLAGEATGALLSAALPKVIPPALRVAGDATIGPGSGQIGAGLGQAALGAGAEGIGAALGHPYVGGLAAGGAILRGARNVIKGVQENLGAARAVRADAASLARDAELRGFTPGQQLTAPTSNGSTPSAPVPPPLPPSWVDDIINHKQTVAGSQPTPYVPPAPPAPPEISGRPTASRFDSAQYGEVRRAPPVEVGGAHIPDYKSPFGSPEEFAARIAAQQPQPLTAPSSVSDPAAFAQLPREIQEAIVRGAASRKPDVPMEARSPEYYGVNAAQHPDAGVRAEPTAPPPVGPQATPGQHPVHSMPATTLDSDAVQAIQYHPESETAAVTIKGRKYELPMTPEMHRRLLAASADPQQSVGTIWNREIRPSLETASGVLRPKATTATPETAAPTLEQRLAASPDALLLRNEVMRRAASQHLDASSLESVVRQAAADINTGRAAGGNPRGTIPDWVVNDVLKGLR